VAQPPYKPLLLGVGTLGSRYPIVHDQIPPNDRVNLQTFRDGNLGSDDPWVLHPTGVDLLFHPRLPKPTSSIFECGCRF
jgi:hypothetical protein